MGTWLIGAARRPCRRNGTVAKPTIGSATSSERLGKRRPERFVKISNPEEPHLDRFIRIVPPDGAAEILGVKLVGVTAENGNKRLFSLAFILLTLLIARGLRWLTAFLLRGRRDQRLAFQARQAIHLLTTGEMGEPALLEIERRYFVRRVEMTPKVYFRLTDNWLELTLRFIARDHGIRELKDAMSREILAALDDAGIGIASSTFEVVGLPPLGLERAPGTDGRG